MSAPVSATATSLWRALARALGLAGVGAAAAATPTARAMAAHLPPHYVSSSSSSWLLNWLPGAAPARFNNPWPDTWPGDKGPRELFALAQEMRRVGAPNHGALTTNPQPTLEEVSRAFPVVPADAAALAAPPASEVQAVWLGHASVLVQLEGLTFVTDPHFSQRASPLQFVGPQRAVQPALQPEDAAFPRLDAVLLSHNHYDHLDCGSVQRLHKRFGGGLAWYVPLGLRAWFLAQGITNVTELDWWHTAQHPGSKVRVMLTPAQHWSARGVLDRRATLWGGWAVLGEAQRFWFAGDTGYCAAFKEIGERCGPFDLAAIPIGAYAPRWFMRSVHINPAEAVQVHLDVRSRKSIGIHCATFNLTTEPLDEPPRVLQEAAAAAGLPPGAFVTLRHGALLRTRGGRDSNAPPLLPLAPASASSSGVASSAGA